MPTLWPASLCGPQIRVHITTYALPPLTPFLTRVYKVKYGKCLDLIFKHWKLKLKNWINMPSGREGPGLDPTGVGEWPPNQAHLTLSLFLSSQHESIWTLVSLPVCMLSRISDKVTRENQYAWFHELFFATFKYEYARMYISFLFEHIGTESRGLHKSRGTSTTCVLVPTSCHSKWEGLATLPWRVRVQ